VAPGTLDYLPAQLAFSRSGAATAGLAIEDVDTPGSAQAYIVSRSAAGSVGQPRRLTGAREVLGLAYAGSALELLTGSSPSGLDCCSATQAVRVSAGGAVGRAQTLVGGLAGAPIGQLVALADGRIVAAVATERGVWTLQSGKSGRFGGQHRLTGASQSPVSVSATATGGDGSVIAWTSASGPPGSADPRTIYYAQGSQQGGPSKVHTLLQIPPGHRIDQLQVVRRGSSATAAWLESWFDSRGNYHSQVRAADFATHPMVRDLSPAGAMAAGLSFAGNAAGAQAAAFQLCNSGGSCTLHAATRGSGSRFGPSAGLGAMDAPESPAVAVGPRGQTVLGWVRSGQPVAAVGSAGGHFGATRTLSSTAFAADITVAWGPRANVLAAWTQGTLNPSLVAAQFSG
jgi:hypothetical protein